MTNDDLVNQASAWLRDVSYPGYSFEVREGHGGAFLQALYDEEDVRTGKLATQFTRKWLLSPHMTKSEVVQTAFKCVLTSAEHRVREWFHYLDTPIFGPHFDVDDLAGLKQRGGRT